MANRKYRRNQRGQFASNGDSGAKVTIGRAGGFANAGHRSRVANSIASRRRKQALLRGGAKAVGTAAGLAAAGAVARRGVKSSPTGAKLGKTIKTIARKVRH